MNRLNGVKVINQREESVNISKHLQGKTVLFYFSAHWCPPCRQFTPMLKSFYEGCQRANIPIEIVFVSADKTKDGMLGYFHDSHGDYLAIDFDDHARLEISKELHVNGIPALMVVNKDGSPVVDPKDARQLVARAASGADIFNEVNEWRKLAGDWTAQSGQRLGTDSGISSQKMSREDMRQARLAALAKRGVVGNKEEPQPKPDLKNSPSIDSIEAKADNVKKLCEMGFDKTSVENALDAAAGDVDTALELLTA